MSETADCLTQLEDAIVAHLEARLGGGVKRVLTAEDVGPDRPIPQRFLPAVVIGLGAESPGQPGPDEGGQDRLIPVTVQIDAMVATDAGEKGFNAKVRSIALAVRTAMAGFVATSGLPLDDLSWAGTTPLDVASEKGLAGGALVAFVAQFMVREGTPGVFEPTNCTSEFA